MTENNILNEVGISELLGNVGSEGISFINSMMNGSVDSAVSFFAWLKNSLGISNLSEMAKSLTEMAKNVGSDGILGSILSSFYTNVAKGINWVSSALATFLQSGSGMAFGTVSYNTVLAFAALCAVVMFVIYKIFKVIKNKVSDTISENRMQLIGIRQALIESSVMFDELNELTESENSPGIISKIIEKATKMAKEIWSWITGGISGGFSKVSKFMHEHPTFRLLCIVAIGVLVSYGLLHNNDAVKTTVQNVRKAIGGFAAPASDAVVTSVTPTISDFERAARMFGSGS